MYIPTNCLEGEQDQEIVCLLTGESYVHLEGNDTTIINSKYVEHAIDVLPARFYKTPFVVRAADGKVRVFGRLD